MVETNAEGQEVIPLYDQWRIAIVDRLKELTLKYEEATQDDGYMDENEVATYAFKSKLISLWLFLGERKVSYPKFNKNFRVLYDLNKYTRCPGKMKVNEALSQFMVLRDLIEVLGYTRPEKQQLDPTKWSLEDDGI